jgi:hypothetical protein
MPVVQGRHLMLVGARRPCAIANASLLTLTVALAVSCAAGLIAAGCQTLNEPIYIPAPAGIDVNKDGAPAKVKGAVVLRFRQPTASEQKTLDDETARLGFAVPWLKRSRIHIEVLYTIQNTDSTAGTFRVGLDGASELTKYDEDAVAAAFVAADQDPIFVPLIAPTPQPLAAGQIYQGTIREDDIVEGSLDLDAMGRWMAPFAAVLYNRSDVNPVGLDMVPPEVVIPALQEIDLTLIADKIMHGEFVVRVRSDDDQLLHDAGDDRLFAPAPAVFTPALPPP